MLLDLYKIDWTAIGSIVTLVAMLVAYWNIRVSDKQHRRSLRFQILLVQHEMEQKRLDDLIECIMTIVNPIKPIVVVDYSKKLSDNLFTESDRIFLDNMATKDEYDNNLLRIKLIKYKKKESAEKVLRALMDLREMYGEWVRIICQLNMFKIEKMYPSSNLKIIISTMYRRIKEANPSWEKDAIAILNNANMDDLDKAVFLTSLYGGAISRSLLDKRIVFEKELYSFVHDEQENIDGMMT